MGNCPPAGVVLTMQLLCKLFDVAPIRVSIPGGKGKVADYWQAAKTSFLTNPRKLTETIMAFDVHNCDAQQILGRIATLIQDPAFDPASIKKASLACERI